MSKDAIIREVSYDAWKETLDARDATIAELKAWKAEMLEVESQWDPQAVGRALNLPLGTYTRAGILPAIEKLLAENASLKTRNEYLEKLAEEAR